MIRDTACNMAWDYPMFFMFDQSVNYCCRAPRIRVSEQEMLEYGSDLFSNHPVFKQRRRSLLNGFKDPACETCWTLEDKGLKSQRREDLFLPAMFNMHQFPSDVSLMNGDFDWSDPKYEETTYTNVVEIVLNNTCDAKCVYCNETFSSQWMSEKKKFGDLPKDYQIFSERNKQLEELFWKWYEDRVKNAPLNRFGFIGGEPFIMEELYECFERLIEIHSRYPTSEKPELCVTTNGGTPPKYMTKWLEYSEKLSTYFKIVLQISGESTEERLEYIRSGVKWERWKSNIEEYASRDHLTLALLPCVSLLSIPRLPDYLEFVFSIYRNTGRLFPLYENSATWPTEISVMSLPSDMAFMLDPSVAALDVFIKEIANTPPTDYKARMSYQGFRSFLQKIKAGNLTNKPLVERKQESIELMTFIKKLDYRRGTNFEQTFPEFAPLYNLVGQAIPTPQKIIPIYG